MVGFFVVLKGFCFSWVCWAGVGGGFELILFFLWWGGGLIWGSSSKIYKNTGSGSQITAF